MAFAGFSAEDFEIFDIPDFAGRMARIRELIKPKLTLIGQELNGPLEGILEEPLYPHVAQHLRRTVNPPVETWVAFSRTRKAYKPFVHLRVGISRERVRVSVFVEDYADDKLLFAERLGVNASRLAGHFKRHPEILAWDVLNKNGMPSRGADLKSDRLCAFSERLNSVKGQHAAFSVPFAWDDPAVGDGPAFLAAAQSAAGVLKPLYLCGVPGYLLKAEKPTTESA